MSERDNLLYLKDMLESIEAIQSFVNGMSFENFTGDRKTFSATIREPEMIGEAAGRIANQIASAAKCIKGFFSAADKV